MKTKLEKRAKNKKDFILLTVMWITMSVFFHVIYIMGNGSSHYWPIYPILGMAIPVALAGTTVFINEYDAKKEEEQSLIKKSYSPDLDSPMTLENNKVAAKEMLNINYNQSDLV